jgi:cold shock CspA family protein
MSDAERRQNGSVLWFKPDKGYGFIRIDERRDIFFHASEWIHDEDPRKDDRVSFIEATDNTGRPRARQVVVVE